MKSLLFFAIVTSLCLHTYAQDNLPASAIGRTKKQYWLIQHDDNKVYAHRMGKWFDKGINETILLDTDTLFLQPGTATVYAGKRTRIVYNDREWLLQIHAGKKTTTIPLAVPADQQTFLRELNGGYWFRRYTDTFDTEYYLAHRHGTFRESINIFDTSAARHLPHTSFRVYADNRLQTLKDSISFVHEAREKLAKRLVENIAGLSYHELKNGIDSLSGQPYLQPVLEALVRTRPSWFFDLSGDLPHMQYVIFHAADSRKMVKILKATDSSSPQKKAFLKHKRDDRGLLIVAIGATLAGLGLLVGAAIALF